MTVAMARGMTREEAAAYVGLSPSAFDSARKTQQYPDHTLPGRRYDRRLLDARMDALSGIKPEGSEAPAVSALDEWRAKRGKRPS